jgi:hypothetical protein
MDRTGDHHVKLNKPGSKRQIFHVFCHMQNLEVFKYALKVEVYYWVGRWTRVSGRVTGESECG